MNPLPKNEDAATGEHSRCKGTVKRQWYGSAHPCKLPAWKDGLCRTHFKVAQHEPKPGQCACCGSLKAKNKTLRERLNKSQSALLAADRLLLKSSASLDKACTIVREAL